MTEAAATSGTSPSSVEDKPADDSVPAGAAHQPGENAQADEGSGDAAGSASSASGPTASDSRSHESPPGGAADSGSPATAPSSGTEAGGAGSSGEPDRHSGPAPAAPSGSSGSSRPRPSFTRPPGMQPPPDKIEGSDPAERPTTSWPAPAVGVPSSPALSGRPGPDGSTTSASGSFPVVSGTAPVSAPPRVTGRATASGVTMHPIGAPVEPGGGDPGEGARAPRSGSPTTPRGPRRARLGVKRIDPWSVMKFSFAVSLVLFIVVIVAASVLYLALDSMGVFASVNATIAELVDSGGGEGETFRVTAQGVIGTAAVLGALNVLLFTSLATLGAFIYNVCADLVGGVEVTLAERE